jgi:3-methylcrotonyl-CoA carboxylase alpha subunit
MKNNVTYIGPSAEVIKITGDKLSSRTIAAKLGIHVPWVLKGRPAEILVAVDNITYPVMVKAVMGGGGKGMRLAEDPYQLRDALKTTASEALQYFADKRVYVEQFIPDARHIEVQIMGDQHGNIVHLFERECSVQRRHQKVIEEAPSEVMTEKNRAMIIEAAMKIAKEIKFTSAGTIEFLVDKNNKIYFLEMNPRLQVEHGVTEMITGIDIVKEQIQIAEGKTLAGEILNCQITGHAIEARIYAEDPENELLPSPGLIYHFIPPKIDGLRIETAVGNFTLLSSEFDPLMAKILVHAETRQQAIKILQNAIRNFVITGVSHNLSMLNAILSDPDYILNKVSTQYLDNKIPEFSDAISLKRNDMITPVIAVALVTFLCVKDNNIDSPWIHGYWRNVKQLRFRQGYEIIELDYVISGTSADFYIEEIKYSVSAVDGLDFDLSGLNYDERKDF